MDEGEDLQYSQLFKLHRAALREHQQQQQQQQTNQN